MDFLQYVLSKFKDIVGSVIDLLPKSPISYLEKNDAVKEIIGYVNFFIPVYLWVSILESWLIAVVVYYIVQVILRWLKVVE